MGKILDSGQGEDCFFCRYAVKYTKGILRDANKIEEDTLCANFSVQFWCS